MAYFLYIILAYIIIAVLAVISRFVPRLPLRIICIAVYMALLLFEGFKQIDGFTENGYKLTRLPVYFSSTFYVTIGLCLFGGNRLKRIGQVALFAGGIILFVVLTIAPKSVLGVDFSRIFKVKVNTYGYFFHMTVILFMAVMVARGEYKPKLTDPIIFVLFLALYMAVAVPVAIVTGINFCGITRSYISVLETLRQNRGQAAYIAVYYLCGCAAGALLIYGYRLILKLGSRLAKKLKKV